MMKTLVALDLETTGLDPRRDAIIEIGAVLFRGSRVEAEYQTLVNPGRPLSPMITELTGINDDMLAESPRITQVLEPLSHFVGDHPILGHSLGFDLSFLKPKGILRLNQTLDTYDLASVILPSADRYGLASLASSLGVPVRGQHRALDDAQTTRLIFLRMRELLAELPPSLIEEIARMGADVDWGAGWVFDEALNLIADEDARTSTPWQWELPPADDLIQRDPLVPAERKQPLDIEEVASLIEVGGPLAKGFSGYEHRPQQATMLRAVAESLSESNHLLVEAGTGTGKSLAYLLPAFAWADTNGERVVVSTNTINLQEQLIHKDIPDLCQALGQDYHAAVLKGRSNYLCPRQVASIRRVQPRTAEEVRVLAKVLIWLQKGGSGDRGEISLRGPAETSTWMRISAENPDCTPDTCQQYAEGSCPYFRARAQAERAHVIIVNHALLLADIGTGSRVIPEYNYLIVDEAHHLESATTRALSRTVTEGELRRSLRQLGRAGSGLLARVVRIAEAGFPEQVVSSTKQEVERIALQARDALALGDRFFASFFEFMQQRRDEKQVNIYSQQERIHPSTRTLPGWTDVEIAMDELQGPLKSLAKRTAEIGDELAELSLQGYEAAEDLAVALRGTGRSLEELLKLLLHFVFEPDANTIYWGEIRPGQTSPSLNMAPLEVGLLVEKAIWHEKESVIMTSATLTTAGEFDYIRQRLNAIEADELALGSPFDFESSALLYLVSDIPEPSTGKPYQRAVERSLVALCRATGGRTLVLFTSRNMLRMTGNAIAGALEREGIRVLEQSEGASRHALLETFRTTERAVLLGTRSFWEGVDVPGEALSVLVIVRLPFDVPSDPIIASRSEAYEAPFDQFAVPEAILRFRQGFGRLIRSHSDRGVVAVLDARILTKRYGQAFIDSLPRSTIRQGHLADLPEAAARWLG